MTDKALEWFKTVLTNWKTIVSIIVFLGSLLGWTVNENIEKEKEIQLSGEQLTTVVQHLTKTGEKTAIEMCKDFVSTHEKRWH